MFNIKKLVVLLLCAGLVFQAHFGIAGPQGGKVVGGNANISQSGPNTTINQTSDRAIINWNSFDIGKNESVRHNMPSSNSAGLHRVVGKGGPSQIEGLLQSNGNIYLVNPAGVVIHNGAKIDVNGFVATSRDIANDNFMKGKMVFDKPGLPGAAIINQGNISLRDNGLAALVAPTVRNDGIIAGKLGKVALGGSDAAWKLDMTGDDLIAFTMDEKQVNTLYAADGTPLASVQNNGKIKAEGGVVVLTASQLDGIVGSVVNNGEISAASAETKGGKIIFRGQGNKVDVVNKGQLDVSSKGVDGGIVRMTGQGAVTHAGKIDATGKTKGGNVVIIGENVTLKSGSRIDASGANGGGTVLVGGNARGKGPETNAKTTLVQSDAEILADAKLYGDGGQIVVWADEKTQFDGEATAKGGENGGDGGMVETSAKLLIIGDPAVVNTSAKKGKSGEWLLDPEDFVIAASGGTMTGQQISDSLENNNVTIEVGEDGEGNGDILVNDAITWNTDTTLELGAYRNIVITNDINLYGDNATLNFSMNRGNLDIYKSSINFYGKNQRLIINDKSYMLIKTIDELQNINDRLAWSYALANDIDGNGYNDFIPIGSNKDKSEYFIGMLNGLGHTISNINIIATNEDDRYLYGLFGESNGDISNLNLKNVNINVTNSNSLSLGVGLLCGSAYGEIRNIFVEGNIWANYGNIGGLIGSNSGEITNCSAVVNIISKMKGSENYKYSIGGIAGINDGYIYSSASNNKISIYGGNFEYGIDIGGFIGTNYGNINNSYAISNMDLNILSYTIPAIGGFVGYADNSGTISNSYCVSDIESNRSPYDIGGFVGTAINQSKFYGGFWNTTISNISWPIGFSTGSVGISYLYGLSSSEMHEQSNYKGRLDFNNIWRFNEKEGYPELRYVAKNVISLSPVEPGIPPEKPNKPVDPTPPIVDPDPDPDPDPKPDPDPNPDNPDNPDPKPDTPDTPDNPDVPENPDPKPDTPDNPDKPVNPDPKPDTPITPEQPSNPGTNPDDTPSQPSTKPDAKPENPGTNQPGKPATPVLPEQPSKPVQPENPATPEQPSNPGTIPGGNTPSQPDPNPETPVRPNQPSNPGNNSGGNNNANSGTPQFPAGTTITYKVIDGNVHVFQDNQHIGIMEGNRIKLDNNDIPVEIEDGKTYVTGGDLPGQSHEVCNCLNLLNKISGAKIITSNNIK